MDKYEYKWRADEIRALIEEKRYEEAAGLADTIDWRNVKNGMMLCTISDLYKVCRRYRDAKEVLLLAYQRNPTGKLILYSLCELSLKLNDLNDALETYNDYVKHSNGDPNRYILQYKLYEAQEISLDERIILLEKYQREERKEKWMYELAVLYHRIGAESSCIHQCDEIITFFGEGTYVVKALELKKRHCQWTYEDRVLYEKISGVNVGGIEISEMNVGKYSTMNLQNELANNVQEVLGYDTQDLGINELDGEIYSADTTEVYRSFKEPEIPMYEEPDTYTEGDNTESYDGQFATPETESVYQTQSVEEISEVKYQPSDEISKQEVTMDTAVIPTEQLQQEMTMDTTVIPTEQLQQEMTMDTTVISTKQLQSEIQTPVVNVSEATQVMDIDDYQTRVIPTDVVNQAVSTVDASAVAYEEPVNVSNGMTEFVMNGEDVVVKSAPDEFNGVQYTQFDEMLSMEGDGQIGLVVPEIPLIDKQITGQMSFGIDSIIGEFETAAATMHDQWASEIAAKTTETRERLLKSFTDSNMYNQAIAEALEEIEAPIEEVASADRFTEDTPKYIDESLNYDEGESVEVIVLEDGTIIEITDDLPEVETDFFEFEEEIIEETIISEETVTAVPEDSYVPVEETGNSQEVVIENIPQVDDSVMQSEISEEPTPEELSFDRTEFIGEGVPAEENNSEDINPEDKANNEVPDDNYLDEFAKSSERYDEVVKENDITEADDIDVDAISEIIGSAVATEVMTETANAPVDVDEAVIRAELTDNSDSDMKVVSKKKKEVKAPESARDVATEKKFVTGDMPVYEGFSDEQIDRFESYIYTESGSEQVKNALGLLSMEASTGNLIIGSTDKDGSIELGKAFIMEISNREKVGGSVAKIKASSLNNKDVADTLTKLKDGALIILDANELNKDTLKKINDVINKPDFRIIIVLSMVTRHKHKFIMENSALLDAFNIRIDIENVDDAELVNYASNYAYSLEYSINDMGSLALHTRIDEKQTNSHNVTISEVREIVDNAIDHASKKTIGHFFDILLGKRYDEKDMVILGEKDFA